MCIRDSYTPEAVKIFEHFGETQDVYYLRRNVERFMTMEPITWRQYLNKRGNKQPFWKVYQRHDSWKPKLPSRPTEGEKPATKGSKSVVGGAGKRVNGGATTYRFDEPRTEEVDSREDGSEEGLSTLDKALLASDAARLANAVRKKASKKKVEDVATASDNIPTGCLLYTSPSPRDKRQSRMPSSA